MCFDGQIISVREVYQEIRYGSDELFEWAKDFEEIFLEPTEAELLLLPDILKKFYPDLLSSYNAKGCADPFVIASAKHHGLSLLQHETIKGNRIRIHYVAKQLGIECVRLPRFFEEQGWQWNE